MDIKNISFLPSYQDNFETEEEGKDGQEKEEEEEEEEDEEEEESEEDSDSSRKKNTQIIPEEDLDAGLLSGYNKNINDSSVDESVDKKI